MAGLDLLWIQAGMAALRARLPAAASTAVAEPSAALMVAAPPPPPAGMAFHQEVDLQNFPEVWDLAGAFAQASVGDAGVGGRCASVHTVAHAMAGICGSSCEALGERRLTS